MKKRMPGKDLFLGIVLIIVMIYAAWWNLTGQGETADESGDASGDASGAVVLEEQVPSADVFADFVLM